MEERWPQSKELAHAARAEILTQHDGARSSCGSQIAIASASCAVIDKLLIRVAGRRAPGLSLTRNFAGARLGTDARQVSAAAKAARGVLGRKSGKSRRAFRRQSRRAGVYGDPLTSRIAREESFRVGSSGRISRRTRAEKNVAGQKFYRDTFARVKPRARVCTTSAHTQVVAAFVHSDARGGEVRRAAVRKCIVLICFSLVVPCSSCARRVQFAQIRPYGRSE